MSDTLPADVASRRRTETWLRTFINTTRDAVVTIDRQERIVLFNPSAERIFGYTHAEVLGQKVHLLMPEPYASEHTHYIERYEQTGQRHAIGRIRTVAARRKNGEIFPIELSVTEIDLGEEIRYGAFIRDISDKLRLQEQLLERERLAAIGTTAAKFAHEVGNPLNGMYLVAQRLDRQLTKLPGVSEALSPHVQSLMGEIRRLNVLLDEFRTLAQRQKLNLQPTSPTLVIQDVLTILAPQFAAQGITVEPKTLSEMPASDMPEIEADGEKLKQVLLNLCKNAVEAMPSGGTLTIRTTQAGDQLSLEVQDTGGGIPEGVDIFEPFVTTKAQGTGLGLTISRQIIAAHRGTLSYESELGQGTTFTVRLPLSHQAEIDETDEIAERAD